MFIKPYSDEYMPQLQEEIKALQLSGYAGIAKLERELDEQGRCVLVDANGDEVVRSRKTIIIKDKGGKEIARRYIEILLDKNSERIYVQDTKPKKVNPYLIIKGDLSPAEEEAIASKIVAHVPQIPTKAEVREEANRQRLSDPMIQAMIRRQAKVEGTTAEQIEGEILSEMAEMP